MPRLPRRKMRRKRQIDIVGNTTKYAAATESGLSPSGRRCNPRGSAERRARLTPHGES